MCLLLDENNTMLRSYLSAQKVDKEGIIKKIILKRFPPMMTYRTMNTHEDFIVLTRALDSELNRRYGKAQADYDMHNVIAPLIRHWLAIKMVYLLRVVVLKKLMQIRSKLNGCL